MAQVGLNDLHFAILSEDTIVFCRIYIESCGHFWKSFKSYLLLRSNKL